VPNGLPSARRTGHLLYAHCVESPDGRGWKKAPKWLARPLGRPVDWLSKKADGVLQSDPPEKALERAESNLAMTIRVFGPDGGPTTGARAEVASKLESMGRFAEARLLREAVVEAHRDHNGPEHLDTLAAELWLAFNLCEQHMLEQARPLVVHACEGRRSLLGLDDERTMYAQTLLSQLDEGLAGE
jgi:hypothetical protein